MPKKPSKPVKPEGKREPKFPSINQAYNQIKDEKARKKAALDKIDN